MVAFSVERGFLYYQGTCDVSSKYFTTSFAEYKADFFVKEIQVLLIV